MTTAPHVHKNKQEDIPPVLERYELKYTIPFCMVDEISRFIEPYCSMDDYSVKSPDNFYTINSLYFDTPELFIYRQRLLKVDTRFNLRVRTYGAEPVLPWFFEIKHKRGDIMQKYRAKIYSNNLEHLLNNPEPLRHHGKTDKEESNRLLFYKLIHTYNAEPKIIVSYKRKAYISDTDEYARITFDIQLRWMKQTNYNPLPVETLLQPCDAENAYDSNASVILELKCYTSFVPLWMVDLIRKYQLNRRGFSKYMTGIRQFISNDAPYNPAVRSVLFDPYDEEME